MSNMFKKFILYIHSGCIRFKMLLHNKRAEVQIPDHILADLARCFVEDIRGYFSIESNQEAYRQWLHAQEQQPVQAPSEKIDPPA